MIGLVNYCSCKVGGVGLGRFAKVGRVDKVGKVRGW